MVKKREKRSKSWAEKVAAAMYLIRTSYPQSQITRKTLLRRLEYLEKYLVEQGILEDVPSSAAREHDLQPTLPASHATDPLGEELLEAADQGTVGEMRKLLAAGADVRYKGPEGTTPLHRAARRGNADVLSFLLARGADPNARDSFGRAALHLAVCDPYGHCVTVLADAKADLDSKDRMGFTALHWATILGTEKGAAMLVGAGACPGVMDNKGKLAADLAEGVYLRRIVHY